MPLPFKEEFVKIKTLALSFAAFTGGLAFAGDPIGTVTYIKQPDGTIQKIEVLDGAETQSKIDTLNALILSLQNQKAELDLRYDTEIANAQRETLALEAAK